MIRLVAFICTGNICRSPMAEYLFRGHILSQPEIRVCSAGVMAGFGTPASRHAITSLEELGIDGRPHRSQPVTTELVQSAELLVVMTGEHREILLSQYPEAADKIVLLKSFFPGNEGEDVMDPIGLSLDVYRHVRDEIAHALWGLDLHLQNAVVGEDKQ